MFLGMIKTSSLQKVGGVQEFGVTLNTDVFVWGVPCSPAEKQLRSALPQATATPYGAQELLISSVFGGKKGPRIWGSQGQMGTKLAQPKTPRPHFGFTYYLLLNIFWFCRRKVEQFPEAPRGLLVASPGTADFLVQV